jgi:hypothetical protein
MIYTYIPVDGKEHLMAQYYIIRANNINLLKYGILTYFFLILSQSKTTKGFSKHVDHLLYA